MQPGISSSPCSKGRFSSAAVVLLLVAVAAAMVQKQRESGAGMTVARRVAAGVEATAQSQEQVASLIRAASDWRTLSLFAVAMAVVAWVVARRRHEPHRGTSTAVVLLAFYIMLELMMV